jgi:hypothetical protein
VAHLTGIISIIQRKQRGIPENSGQYHHGEGEEEGRGVPQTRRTGDSMPGTQSTTAGSGRCAGGPSSQPAAAAAAGGGRGGGVRGTAHGWRRRGGVGLPGVHGESATMKQRPNGNGERERRGGEGIIPMWRRRSGGVTRMPPVGAASTWP